MAYTHAVPRAGGGGFGRFLLILALLAIVGGALVLMLSHAQRRHGEEFVKTVSSQCNENNH